MDLKSLGSTIAKSAPILGAALTATGVGAPVGLILSGLGALFGATENTPEAILEKIKADPEAYLKLRQFEVEHEHDLYKIANEDRDSARKMAAATAQATGKQDWALHFLAISYTLAFFAYSTVGLVYPAAFDKGMWHDLLNVEMLILSFYFGGMYIQRANVPQQIILPPPAETR